MRGVAKKFEKSLYKSWSNRYTKCTEAHAYETCVYHPPEQHAFEQSYTQCLYSLEDILTALLKPRETYIQLYSMFLYANRQ